MLIGLEIAIPLRCSYRVHVGQVVGALVGQLVGRVLPGSQIRYMVFSIISRDRLRTSSFPCRLLRTSYEKLARDPDQTVSSPSAYSSQFKQ